MDHSNIDTNASTPTPTPTDADVADALQAIEQHLAAETDTASVAAIEPSATVSIAKLDSRCRGWAMIVRDEDDLPAPAAVTGAGSLKQPYLRQVGTEELLGTDALLQGEENHHRKSRGWTYWMDVRDPVDGQVARIPLTEVTKRRIKAAMASGRCTMPVEYLRGSGEVAAMVRALHAIRHGMSIDDLIA